MDVQGWTFGLEVHSLEVHSLEVHPLEVHSLVVHSLEVHSLVGSSGFGLKFVQGGFDVPTRLGFKFRVESEECWVGAHGSTLTVLCSGFGVSLLGFGIRE